MGEASPWAQATPAYLPPGESSPATDLERRSSLGAGTYVGLKTSVGLGPICCGTNSYFWGLANLLQTTGGDPGAQDRGDERRGKDEAPVTDSDPRGVALPLFSAPTPGCLYSVGGSDGCEGAARMADVSSLRQGHRAGWCGCQRRPPWSQLTSSRGSEL